MPSSAHGTSRLAYPATLAMLALALLFPVALMVFNPTLMFERAGPLHALSRSWELIRGHWWPVFGALFVALGIVVGVSFLVDGLLGAAASSSSVDAVLTLAGISRALAAIITYPLLAAISVVIYVGLRAVKEGTTAAV